MKYYCLYVDNGTFPFGTREDLQCGIELIHHHFARFGLEMYIGLCCLASSTILPTPGADKHCV
jgi:hypothetical protein